MRTGTEVPFLDLRRRIEALGPEVQRQVERVAASGRLILGDLGREIEDRFARYCGVDHGVGVGSGTDALWLALLAAGVEPGDEVITVSNTCVPTIAAILQAGATPVMVDVDPTTMTMDPEAAEAAITDRTRCLLPVHLYGQAADVVALARIADAHGVLLIEDCAQAHGAEIDGRRVGSFGTAGCFSFYPSKNLGAFGDGGMVVTDDAELAERVRLLRFYGYGERNRAITRGFNSRLDEVQAGVLLAALPHLDAWTGRRRALAARYHDRLAALEGLMLPAEAAGRTHVYHLYVVRSERRDELRRRLTGRGVQTLVHYPVPVHLQEGYADACTIADHGLAVTEELAGRILSLPLYPELRDDEIEAVIEAVSDAVDPC